MQSIYDLESMDAYLAWTHVDHTPEALLRQFLFHAIDQPSITTLKSYTPTAGELLKLKHLNRHDESSIRTKRVLHRQLRALRMEVGGDCDVLDIAQPLQGDT